MTEYRGYQNNPNLPREGYRHNFTQHELDEFVKCMNDPVYFAMTYMKIIHVDHGLMPFEMWDFQQKMLKSFHENRFNICKLPRQVGKTTVSVAYLLHYILFNTEVNCAILANKLGTAREIMGRLQLAYEHLPPFLKQGVRQWNKSSLELANGSRISADSTSGSSVRGKTFNIIFLDEFAHVPENIAEAFFNSTYPTISSGKTTKVIIVSTPLGLNLFYKIWTKAVEKKNQYVPIEVHWSMVPGRDEAWKKEQIENTSEEQFRQEFECEFVGSTNTLIHSTKLSTLVDIDPILVEEGGDMYVWEKPIEKHTYVISVDVSEGQNLDYSAFSVVDVTTIPYKVVARYRNNKIQPILFPTIIVTSAQKYNDAHVLVEINSIGLQVADIIHYELSYENLIKVQMKGKQGQQYTGGFAKKMAFGLKQTVQTKKIGCVNLKTLIESDKLLVYDFDTIFELKTFVSNKASFAAEEGKNDDLVMSLVNFGWLTGQKFFKESVENDVRSVLQKEQLRIMDEDFVPFGIIDDGFGNDYEVDAQGDVWVEDRQSKFPFDDFNWRSKL